MDKLRAREDILNYALAYIKQKNKEFENSPFYIDEKIAKKAVLFISLLKHTDGELAGKPFQLLNFQSSLSSISSPLILRKKTPEDTLTLCFLSQEKMVKPS